MAVSLTAVEVKALMRNSIPRFMDIINDDCLKLILLSTSHLEKETPS